jgi:hypothetical protein
MWWTYPIKLKLGRGTSYVAQDYQAEGLACNNKKMHIIFLALTLTSPKTKTQNTTTATIVP